MRQTVETTEKTCHALHLDETMEKTLDVPDMRQTVETTEKTCHVPHLDETMKKTCHVPHVCQTHETVETSCHVPRLSQRDDALETCHVPHLRQQDETKREKTCHGPSVWQQSNGAAATGSDGGQWGKNQRLTEKQRQIKRASRYLRDKQNTIDTHPRITSNPPPSPIFAFFMLFNVGTSSEAQHYALRVLSL